MWKSEEAVIEEINRKKEQENRGSKLGNSVNQATPWFWIAIPLLLSMLML
jgi:hypothetical protein